MQITLTDEKLHRIGRLISSKTYPKDQFGFYSLDDLLVEIAKILQN